MVATRKQKIQVFIFLLVCLLITLLIIYFVSGMYSNYGIKYWIEFDESVLGVYEGGVVEYLGVPVGKVEEIRVSPEGKPIIYINIDSRKVTLHKGVEANIVIYSLAAGTMAISLSGGDPNAPVLPPGSKIPARRSTISAVSSRIEELMDDIKNILDSIKTGLEGIETGDLTKIAKKVDSVLEKGENFLNDLQKTVKKINSTMENLEPKISETMDAGEKTVNKIKELSEKTDKLITVITEKAEQIDVQKTQDNVNSAIQEIKNLSQNVDGLVNELKNITTSASYKADNLEFSLQKTLQEINYTLESLRNLLESIRKNPSTIIRGKTSDKEGK